MTELDGLDDVTSESFSRVSEFVGAVDGADDPFRGLLEKQIITKPGKCPTDPEEFDDWRFRMENFLIMLAPEFEGDLETALSTELHGVEELNDRADTQLRRRSVALYGMLAGLCSGRQQLLVKENRTKRNGFMVWRSLIEDFIPANSENLKLQLASELTEGKEFASAGRGADFQSCLLRYEAKVKKYEKMGTKFDQTIQRGVLLRFAPIELATYLRVTPGAIKTYAGMRASIESYLRSLGKWNQGDIESESVPMDIGGVDVKQKIKDGACYRCGSEKHRAEMCPHWQSTCRICGKVGHISTACKSAGKGKQRDDPKGKGKGKGKDDPKGKGKGKYLSLIHI